LWKSTSYLLWILRPDYDINAEYGCKAQHKSFNTAKTVGKTLSMNVNFFLCLDQSMFFESIMYFTTQPCISGPPKAEWLVIESKPLHPIEGGSVMLEVKRKNLQNSFPSPVLLWTNKVNYFACCNLNECLF